MLTLDMARARETWSEFLKNAVKVSRVGRNALIYQRMVASTIARCTPKTRLDNETLAVAPVIVNSRLALPFPQILNRHLPLHLIMTYVSHPS
jgi:hypothetical protein